jgi:hypothetical protein
LFGIFQLFKLPIHLGYQAKSASLQILREGVVLIYLWTINLSNIMETFRIKMTPKGGGSISYAIMQGPASSALWSVAKQAYPNFTILQVEEMK